MKHRCSTWSLILVAVIARDAIAFEPPRPSVAEAMGAGSLAFIARVTSLEETNRTTWDIRAVARVSPLMCLYGPCRDLRPTTIGFALDTVRDRGMGVNFLLGEEYLFIFKEAKEGRHLEFVADWARRFDAAYLLKTPLKPFVPEEVTDLTLVYVWGGPHENLKKADLVRMGSERAATLRKAGTRRAH